MRGLTAAAPTVSLFRNNSINEKSAGMAEEKYQLQTLTRAFEALRIVAEAAAPPTLSEIAERLGTGTTIAFRLLKSLEANGYVERGADKRYRRPAGWAAVPTLTEGLRLLRELAASDGGVPVPVLAARLGLSRSRVEDGLRQLREAGLAETGTEEVWSVSAGILGYAAPVLTRDATLAKIRPVMAEFVRRTNETVSWFRRVGWNQVVVEAIPSSHPVRYVLDVGTSFPLYVGAAGKAHLASLPIDEVEAYLADLRPAAFTRHLVDPQALAAELAVIRSRGYATSSGERVEGAASVAVAVAGSGGTLGVLGVMFPIFRTSPALLDGLGVDLVERTRDLFRSPPAPGRLIPGVSA